MARKVPDQPGARQSRAESAGRARRPWVVAIAMVAAAAGLAGCATQQAAARDAGPVVLGVDVLLRDSLHLLRGRRVGLITNHTGVSWADSSGSPVSTIDRLQGHAEIELVALFSPEHGIRGDVDRPVDSSTDEVTGLPIHSLYGDTRRPTPAMLDGIDAMVFDIQDIGTRYYSYVWTMALAMEAAAEHGLRFVVLDRPNPIGGVLVQGNIRPSYTPVAYYEAAMRHGLTAGELARYLNGEYGLGVDLHIVPMGGWTRSMWWEETGVPWRAPSPNMPSVESATHYPGTCLFEGTNLSVGRGTDRAFQQVGAPWLDAEAVVAALQDRGFPGVVIEAVGFTPDAPTDGKFAGQALRGIRLTVADRSAYDPIPVAVAALLEITRRHPAAFVWRDGWFDGLAGGPRLRLRIQAAATLEEITAPWAAEQAAFEAARTPYLLYP
jgi:uncharacterized protein YbbC (DUF1343 family)